MFSLYLRVFSLGTPTPSCHPKHAKLEVRLMGYSNLTVCVNVCGLLFVMVILHSVGVEHHLCTPCRLAFGKASLAHYYGGEHSSKLRNAYSLYTTQSLVEKFALSPTTPQNMRPLYSKLCLRLRFYSAGPLVRCTLACLNIIFI